MSSSLYSDALYEDMDVSATRATPAAATASSTKKHATYKKKEDEEEEEESLKIVITSSSSSNNNDNKALFVEIFPEEMSSIAPATMLSVLKEENAPMSAWTDAAVMYAQCGKAKDGLILLQEACSFENVLGGDKNDRVRLLASTGIAHLTQVTIRAGSSSTTGGVEGDNNNKALADDRFTQATRIDQLYPMTWIGKGMLNAFNGRLDQARYFFDTTLKHVGPVLPALLGMASVEFYEKNYHKALKLYGTAIQLYPSSPKKSAAASIRVGFGLCCYKLGQVDRARAAFQRAHELDPHNVEAMTYVAVLSLNALGDCAANTNNKEETYNYYLQQQEQAIKLLSVAHLMDRNNATVQLRLADHYFWKWELVSGAKISVSKSNPKLLSSTIPLHLEPGERIRIGADFETVVSPEEEAEDEQMFFVGGRTTFPLRDAWPSESADNLRLWRKDYDRVDDLAKAAYASTSVPELQAESLFHRARVLHTKGMLEEASKFYAKATEIFPDLTPARWGWAQCQITLGQYSDAMNNLLLVTTQSPQATEAFAVLGLLQIVLQQPISTTETAVTFSSNDRKQALANLKKATELDPTNVEWILLQALVYQTNKAEYSMALERYKKAVEVMELHHNVSNDHSVAVPPHIWTNIGVIHQELCQYDAALVMYEKAMSGLATSGDSSTNDEEEDTNLDEMIIREETNKLFWTFVDSGLKVAKPLLGVSDKLLVTNDPDQKLLNRCNLRVGDHVKIGNSDHAYTSEVVEVVSQEATTMLRLNTFSPPLDDDNNEECFAVFVKRPTPLLRYPLAITIAFNLARLHEDAGRPVAAVELHKAILKKHPSYVNCYLRLACISRDNGLLDECTQWLQGAVKVAPTHPEVLTLVGNLHLSLSDWQPAQRLFDKLLNMRNPAVEAYSLLSLGNIYFSTLYTSPERYEKNLSHSAEYYRKVLAKDKSNYYAANGLGTVLAEKGDLLRAKDIFNRVREVSGDAIPDPLLNLGHIYLAQMKHPEALQMYTSYMNRTSKGYASSKEEVSVLLYIAFAYFDWARQTETFNNAKAAPADGRYAKCIEYIELAMKSQNENCVLKYNWCMAKLQAANCTLQKVTRNIPRTAQEVKEALIGLESSLPLVQQLMSWKASGKKVPISKATLAGFISQCQDNIDMTKNHLNEEIKKEEEIKELREIQRLEAQQLQLQRERELLAKKEIEERAQQEQELKAKAKMDKVSNLLENWEREAKDKEAASEAKKSRKSGSVVPQPMHDDDEQQAEGASSVPIANTLFDESSDEDEDDNENSEEVIDEKSADPAMEAEKSISPAAQLSTQKDLFGDSDESDDDEDHVPPVAGTKRDTVEDVEEDSDSSKSNKRRKLDE